MTLPTGRLGFAVAVATVAGGVTGLKSMVFELSKVCFGTTGGVGRAAVVGGRVTTAALLRSLCWVGGGGRTTVGGDCTPCSCAPGKVGMVRPIPSAGSGPSWYTSSFL